MLKAICAAILLTGAFYVQPALACSCMQWLNPQQAALSKGAIVARVETLKSYEDGRADLRVRKVIKGSVKQTKVQVLGQDGLNCNGEMIHQIGATWYAIFARTDEGYQTISCAETALTIDPQSEKIKVLMQEQDAGKAFAPLLSEAEFKQLVRYRIRPSVIGLRCGLSTSRTYVDLEHPGPNPYDFNFWTSAASPDGTLHIDASYDLSKQGPRLGDLKAVAHAKPISSDRFKLTTALVDPYFSDVAALTSHIDLRKSYSAGGASLSKFTNLDGEPHEDDEPFLAHDTNIDCAVSVGLPFVKVD